MKLAIDLGTPYFPTAPWETQITYAVEAERLGLDFVWSAEAWGYYAITPLTYLADKTSRIRLGTGILSVTPSRWRGQGFSFNCPVTPRMFASSQQVKSPGEDTCI